MKVLLIGSGGREHALAWAIKQSPAVRGLWIAPGNPGTGEHGINLKIDPMDFDSIYGICRKESIDLVVVGPENPLAAGIGDFLTTKGFPVFGPKKEGAQLEASKSRAKEFMARHGIPHARFAVFESYEEVLDYLGQVKAPWVIKADGLAYGKGVVITSDFDEAAGIARHLLSGKLYGQSGKRIVIEEFLQGIEATQMALCDGNTMFCLPMAKDHKRIFDGDKGPMTGGMGCYSPLPFVTAEMEKRIYQDVLQKTLIGLQRDGINYRGVIYAGLMLTDEGPKVLEYNVRFGDPEAQCVLPRLKGDFAGLLMSCAKGSLGAFLEDASVGIRSEAAVSVVMASRGYPGEYTKGYEIKGLEAEKSAPSHKVLIFQAGTARDENGMLVTSGGRVLSATAFGSTIDEARLEVYAFLDRITFPGCYYRKDVGLDLGVSGEQKGHE